jgi:L-seryl-tRNA(Ser) seleniumtransferase
MLLRVHRSNFRIEGFTEQPSLLELAALGRERGVTVVEDLGSGYIGIAGEARGDALDALLGGEPRVAASVAAGIDIVCFSGDKLLGGPQAGIIVGRGALVDTIRGHPLMRALRVDKLTYAALEATLGEYLAGRASRTVPLLRMLTATPEAIGARAEAIREGADRELGGRARFDVVDGESAVGGGTTPGLEVRTRLLAVYGLPEGVDWLDERLRQGETPLVARIERDRLLIDLRTVSEEDDGKVLAALSKALLGIKDEG